MTHRPAGRIPFVLGFVLALLPWGQPAWGGPADVAVSQEVRDRVFQKGAARVIVELRLPGGRHVPEGELSGAAALVQRQDIASTRAQVISRLRPTAHRVIRHYETVPLVVLEVGPAALAELEAASFLVTRVVGIP